ncbi:MAG: AAA family ATPase [Chitinophagales bacterium]|nr:AAA family ATPase [Chitinophagales bacterium]
MEPQTFQRSKHLNNIPQKKLIEKINEIKKTDLDQKTKNVKIILLNRFAESNIPIIYWDIWMEKNFKGDPRLLEKYNEYTKEIQSNYLDGKSICFCGSYGTGKTFTISSILKTACVKNYTCLYITLSDLVSSLTSYDDKFTIRKELNSVDFLAIDEFDNRFILSENASDLYAMTLENIFRTRLQNKLPTIFATNSPKPLESFKGSLKASLSSIFSRVEFFIVLGEDFRRKE